MEPILPKWLSTIYQFPSSPFHELTKIVGEESRMKKAAVAESETCFSDLPAPWHILADVNSEEVLIPPPWKFSKSVWENSDQTRWADWIHQHFSPRMTGPQESSQNGTVKLYSREEKSVLQILRPYAVCHLNTPQAKFSPVFILPSHLFWCWASDGLQSRGLNMFPST